MTCSKYATLIRRYAYRHVWTCVFDRPLPTRPSSLPSLLPPAHAPAPAPTRRRRCRRRDRRPLAARASPRLASPAPHRTTPPHLAPPRPATPHPAPPRLASPPSSSCTSRRFSTAPTQEGSILVRSCLVVIDCDDLAAEGRPLKLEVEREPEHDAALARPAHTHRSRVRDPCPSRECGLNRQQLARNAFSSQSHRIMTLHANP